MYDNNKMKISCIYIPGKKYEYVYIEHSNKYIKRTLL